MLRVTIRDVNQQEFIRALAAFLRKFRKPKVPEQVGTTRMKMAEKEQDGGCKLILHSDTELPEVRIAAVNRKN
ncbi:hypothetical protein J0S82_009815 [Galemys pyrenaicus]|uniref:Uncharacterized protein n=1 Tax=Galemys pyrenaicus TaxID=202257 RepID=A0A8J6E1M4_GALPY|nr:hypothetical protein J0S82_009815 [Galemys pyrenaicus]